ncbi:MAG TPA: hypothetical protein VHP36_02495 [Chitinispirillaceae bacterium]|nr:hypothetical protein [Chitinispirillaceae bacterium]
MKLVLTVTAVFDFSDDISIEEINENETTYGQHITYKGHKIQPVIDFLEYQGKTDDTHTWEVPDEQLSDELYDCQESEDYTIIEIEKKEDN